MRLRAPMLRFCFANLRPRAAICVPSPSPFGRGPLPRRIAGPGWDSEDRLTEFRLIQTAPGALDGPASRREKGPRPKGEGSELHEQPMA